MASEDFSGIKTIKEEFDYWSKLGNRYDQKPEVTDRAQQFAEHFKNINGHFSELSNKNFIEVVDILEVVQDSLDGVWKTIQFAVYSESRMKHVFSIVGSTLASFIESKLPSSSIWKEDVTEVRESLRKALTVSEKWIQVTDTLTTRFWSGWDRHPWTSGKYEDPVTKQLTNRLEQIINLRSVHDQLVRLLSTEEKQELGIDKVFTAFSSIKPFDTTPSSEANWQSATKSFELAIAPVEQRVAGKLRLLFSGLGEQTYQLLREFHRFKELISRPTINKELSSEREVLLAQLQTYLSSIREDFENRSKQLSATKTVGDDQPLKGRNLPEVVNNIVWVRQIISRVEHMSATSQAILQDLPRTSHLISSASTFLDDLRNYQKEQYNTWVEEMEASLKDPDSSLVLQMTGRMMSLDLSSGQLQVNYSERLVTLLREVRQLTALGFKISRNIRNAADTAAKFYRHGIILQQVANFYNSFSQQIIPSQKLMLLRASVNFETIVKNTNPDGKGVVSWSTPNQAEAFIEKLQQAAERLTSENRKLRKYHLLIADKVVQLMSVDVIRNQV